MAISLEVGSIPALCTNYSLYSGGYTMKFRLPILAEEFDAEKNEIIGKESYIDCELNFTLDAQQTWEDNFPEQSKSIGLFDFVEQMREIKIIDQVTAGIALKIIYCFILFDREMSFRDFVRLFTFSNEEYFTKLCNILKNVLTAINQRNENKKKY